MQRRREREEDTEEEEYTKRKPLEGEEDDEKGKEDGDEEINEEDNTNMTERVKGIKGKEEKRTNINTKANRSDIKKQRLLIKFEIDKKNEEDAIKMARIIARAANLKKETTHYVAKFLFEECLAEYRSENMLG
jgi:hypothetical protein